MITSFRARQRRGSIHRNDRLDPYALLSSINHHEDRPSPRIGCIALPSVYTGFTLVNPRKTVMDPTLQPYS